MVAVVDLEVAVVATVVASPLEVVVASADAAVVIAVAVVASVLVVAVAIVVAVVAAVAVEVPVSVLEPRLLLSPIPDSQVFSSQEARMIFFLPRTPPLESPSTTRSASVLK